MEANENNGAVAQSGRISLVPKIPGDEDRHLIVCVGEALVDLFPQPPGVSVRDAHAFTKAAGGAVLNVAVGIARLGGAAAFVGCVSTDAFGESLLDAMAREGVDASGVVRRPNPTRLAFVEGDRLGDRTFSFANESDSADRWLQRDDLPLEMIRAARALHAGGGTLAKAPIREATLRASGVARDAGRFVSFDLNVRPSLFDRPDKMRENLLAGCATATLVKCSLQDLDELHALGVDESRLLATGPTAVVVTLGDRGCRWTLRDGTSATLPSPRVDVTDTTGAGDAFMAALLVEFARVDFALTRSTLTDATRIACAAGAHACTVEGAIPSLPRPNDLTTSAPLAP
jgi:sugar/nucleoside kinase (ribokinase family)